MLQTILSISQMVLAALLTLLILIQQKGAGLGMTFGGTSNIYSTKRGIDRVVFRTTIAVAIIFFSVSLLMVVLK